MRVEKGGLIVEKGMVWVGEGEDGWLRGGV